MYVKWENCQVAYTKIKYKNVKTLINIYNIFVMLSHAGSVITMANISKMKYFILSDKIVTFFKAHSSKIVYAVMQPFQH